MCLSWLQWCRWHFSVQWLSRVLCKMVPFFLHIRKKDKAGCYPVHVCVCTCLIWSVIGESLIPLAAPHMHASDPLQCSSECSPILWEFLYNKAILFLLSVLLGFIFKFDCLCFLFICCKTDLSPWYKAV